jgi:hypothetical protein
MSSYYHMSKETVLWGDPMGPSNSMMPWELMNSHKSTRSQSEVGH